MLKEHVEREKTQALETRIRVLESGKGSSVLRASSWAQVAEGHHQQPRGCAPSNHTAGSMNVGSSMNMKRLDNTKEETKSKSRIRKDIVAAFTKPIGEVVLITASMEGREALEERKEWAAVSYGSAEVLQQTFSVVSHGARRGAVDEKRQDEIVEEITRVWWPKHAERARENLFLPGYRTNHTRRGERDSSERAGRRG